MRDTSDQQNYSGYPNSIKIFSIISLICAVSFGVLAIFVSNGLTKTFDVTILSSIHQLQSPLLDLFFSNLTNLGGLGLLGTATLLLVFYLIYKKQYNLATITGISVGGAALLHLALKSLIERPRPDLWQWIISETNFSFPSGHSTATIAFALCICLIATGTRRQKIILILAAIFVCLIGLSRLYLGVHYPTDVLGGWLLGTSGTLAIAVIVHSIIKSRR